MRLISCRSWRGLFAVQSWIHRELEEARNLDLGPQPLPHLPLPCLVNCNDTRPELQITPRNKRATTAARSSISKQWPTKPPPLSWTSKSLRFPNPRPVQPRTRLRASPLPPIADDDTDAHSGTGFSKLGFAGNDSPSFVFPTAIATKGPAGSSGGTGSGRPAVANKPTFLTGGAGPQGHLSMKRGTEDLDFFIGDEAITAAAGPGWYFARPQRNAELTPGARLWFTLPDQTRPDRKLGVLARQA